MHRKLLVSLTLIAFAIGTGIGIRNALMMTKPPPPKTATERPPIVVESIRLEPETLIAPVVGYGNARADRNARVSAQVSGQVVSLAEELHPGAAFEEGDVLIKIDERDYQQRLQQAESQVRVTEAKIAQLDIREPNLQAQLESGRKEMKSAEWELRRREKLYKENVGLLKELEDARRLVEQTRRSLQALETEVAMIPTQREQLQATLAMQQSSLDLTRLNLQRCTVRAPFAGTVNQVMVELGEQVQAGMPLLSLMDTDLIEVPVELPLTQRDQVRVGAVCTLTMTGHPEIQWIGRVRRISPSAREMTRTFSVYVEVDNQAQAKELMPGSFVKATVEGPLIENVLIVPRGVIQDSRVYVFNEGTARERKIKVQRDLIDKSLVTGVQPGDVVITSNLDVLFDGARVALESAQMPAPRHAAADRPDAAVSEHQ